MARIVKIKRSGPYRIETSDGILYVCGCGCRLSRVMPYCDDSHKRRWDEDPAKLYEYDESLRAEEIKADDDDSAR